LHNLRLDLPDSLPQNEKLAVAVPSPGGEGQDEGGRKHIFIFTSSQRRLFLRRRNNTGICRSCRSFRICDERTAKMPRLRR